MSVSDVNRLLFRTQTGAWTSSRVFLCFPQQSVSLVWLDVPLHVPPHSPAIQRGFALLGNITVLEVFSCRGLEGPGRRRPVAVLMRFFPAFDGLPVAPPSLY